MKTLKSELSAFKKKIINGLASKSKLRDKIIFLREHSFSYESIQSILSCSRSIICYHVTEENKRKNIPLTDELNDLLTELIGIDSLNDKIDFLIARGYYKTEILNILKLEISEILAAEYDLR